nr:putative lrr receptor-like serine/threonine-protein kinase [Quercus suber]
MYRWMENTLESKGTLNDGRLIAVKQLSVTSHQGKNQFITEIATISTVQHRNLVKLDGCCIKGDKRLLVYEYLENKSLDQALFDFGLAKLYDDEKTHISTRVAGTIGYLAPEYAMRGHLTEKADVFAFGVVALEIVSGRPNADSSLEEEEIYLLEWAWKLHENNREVDLVDSALSEFNEEEVKRQIGVSLLCTQASPTLRPSMSRVVAMLSGDIEVSIVTSWPGYLTDWKYDDVTNVTTMSGGATIGTDTSYYNSLSASASMVGDLGNSPGNASKPMLGEIIKEGR